jgi:anti-sigma factor RsiW
MADIIPLPGDRHQETIELLPWYVTGRITPIDRVKVEAHLADCAECRGELAIERRLHSEVAQLPLDAGLGFAELRRRLELPPAAPARRPARTLEAMRRAVARPGRKGWAIAAQAAALLLVVGVTIPSLQLRSRPQPEMRPEQYQTLGSAPTHPAGNLLVMFRPETSEQQLRALITQSGARVVDGPTQTGAYMLLVPATEREAVLVRLRAQSAVTLVQPIDASPQS